MLILPNNPGLERTRGRREGSENFPAVGKANLKGIAELLEARPLSYSSYSDPDSKTCHMGFKLTNIYGLSTMCPYLEVGIK